MNQRGVAARMAVLAIAALALRPQLIGVGPLVPQIRTDLGMSFAEAGLLTTIPLLCMGVFALTTPSVVAALGPGRTLAGCLLLITLAGALRGLAPDGPWLLILTVPAGLGIGTAGAAFPVLVKEWFPGRGATATGVYTTSIQLGSTVSAGIAVPLSLALGGWRGTLEAYAAVAMVSVAGWLLFAPRSPRPPRRTGRGLIAPIAVRSPVAWLLAALFALTAVPYYGLSAWLPSAYVERGWSAVDAGALLAAFGLAGLPASLVASVLADRVGTRRHYLVIASLVVIVSLTGLIVAPGLAWLWAVTAGAFLGVLFTIGLTLPLDVSHDPARVAPVVGLMLFVGYIAMAFMPALLGAVRDATGSFTTSLWLIVGSVVLLFGASLLATPDRLTERPPDRLAERP